MFHLLFIGPIDPDRVDGDGKGLTQKGFAEAVGLTVSAVSKIEIGDRVPSIDTFVLLSDFFGVSLDYLVLGKEH